jgi:hypothetical protein
MPPGARRPAPDPDAAADAAAAAAPAKFVTDRVSSGPIKPLPPLPTKLPPPKKPPAKVVQVAAHTRAAPAKPVALPPGPLGAGLKAPKPPPDPDARADAAAARQPSVMLNPPARPRQGVAAIQRGVKGVPGSGAFMPFNKAQQDQLRVLGRQAGANLAAAKRNSATASTALSQTPKQALRGAASSAQVYPSRIVAAPATKLSPADQLKNKQIQAAGVGDPTGLHTFLHRTLGDVVSAGLAAPGGIYHAAGAVGSDVMGSFGTGVGQKADWSMPRSRKVVSTTLQQVGQDFQHPFAHPGRLALDVSGIGASGLSTAERVGTAVRAAKAGEGVGAVTKALATKPVPGIRTLKYQNLKEPVAYSEHPVLRLIQKQTDKRTGGVVSPAKIARETVQNQRIREGYARALPHTLEKAGKRVSTVQKAALQSVQENFHPLDRAASERQLATTQGGVAAIRHNRIAKTYEAAANYVDRTPQGIRLKPEATLGRSVGDVLRRKGVSQDHLQSVLNLTDRVIAQREKIVGPEGAGLVSPAQMDFRRNAPVRVSMGQSIEPKPARPAPLMPRGTPPQSDFFPGTDFSPGAGVWKIRNETDLNKLSKEERGTYLRLANMDTPKSAADAQLEAALKAKAQVPGKSAYRPAASPVGAPVVAEPNLFGAARNRVPSVPTWAKPRASAPVRSAQGLIGFAKKPRTVTTGYTGALRRAGLESQNITKNVAGDTMEALRHQERLSAGERLVQASTPGKLKESDVGIRPLALKDKPLPFAVKAVQGKLEQGGVLTKSEQALLAPYYERIPYDEQKVMQEQAQAHGVRYVDKRIADALLPEARFASGGGKVGKAALATLHGVNSVGKAGILYAKLGFGLPNFLSQVMLSMSHQGIHAADRFADAASAAKTLGPAADAKLRELGGAGPMSVFDTTSGPSAANLVVSPTRALAAFWHRLILSPEMRKAAVLHEMARRGFKTDAQKLDFLSNPAHDAQRVVAGRAARRAMIDYQNMGPSERAFTQHALFIYPWFKGASVWTKDFIEKHPAQAMAYMQAGVTQEQRNKRELGNLPGWAQGRGYFQVGNRNVPGLGKMPLTTEPGPVAVPSTPLSIVHDIGDMIQQGRVTIPNYLQPGLAGAVATGLRLDPLTGQSYPKNKSWQSILEQNTIGTSAGATLYRKLSNKSPASAQTFPETPTDAWMHFGIGGIAPRPMNLPHMASLALKDKLALMSSGQKLTYYRTRDHQQVDQFAKKIGIPKTTTSLIHRGIDMQYARKSAFAAKAAQLGIPASHLTLKQNSAHRLAVELGVLKNFGVLPAGVDTKALMAKAWKAQKTHAGQLLVAKVANEIWSGGVKDATKGALTLYHKALKEHP